MPITENNFTPEEFTAAITANPELINHVTGALTAKQFIVQDQETHNRYLETKVTEAKNGLTKEHAEKLEADVLTLTGIAKSSPTEKYYDYFKRATTEKLAKTQELETKLADLQSKANPTEAQKLQIKELEGAIEKTKNTLQGEITKRDARINELMVGNAASSDLAKVRALYRKDLPGSLVAMAEQAAMQKIIGKAKLNEDGSVVFLKEDGTPALDQTTFKPLTAEHFLKEELKELFEQGNPNNKGAGSGNNNPPAGGGDGKTVLTATPAGVATQMQLTDWLLKNGYVRGSKEFDESYTAANKDASGKPLPLR